MNRPPLFPFLLLLLVARFVHGEETLIPAKDRTVLLISIDGFPAWLWNDPTLPVPNLRKLAAEGATAGAMTVSNPSITWINHTTLVTGVTPRRHGVLFNGLLVRQPPPLPPVIEQWRDKADLVHVPTIYDVAHQSGLTTAQVDWVAVLHSGTIDWEMLEIPNTAGIIERELIAQGLLTGQEMATFSKGKNVAWRDMIWTRAAVQIIKTRKPNLLLFHALTTDAVNHAAGPGSQASYTAFGYVDRLVGDLLAALSEAGLKDKSTVIVTTDHGFKKVSKLIYPNVVLRKAGLIQVDKELVSACDAYVMAQGGMAFVYVSDPARREALLPQLRELFTSTEGVERVIDGTEGPTMGMPLPSENQGMGDLVLFPKAGYAFQSKFDGEEAVIVSTNYLGTHGYPNTDPQLDGAFIASGYGIKPGVTIPRITNLDVAPTIAELLGVKLPNPDGRVLKELLK
ncbi:MAG: Type phosphodiesterase / nucleotide pyrophosphatase [Chthoniobacteraceae bacterium]|nr:Type phosphodiesterase / nucleotide pyrophosphatase [Chthoniobacteraceae bacterium]